MSVPIIHFELIISATVATTGCIDSNILTRIYGLNVRINYHGIQYLFQSNHCTEPDLHFRPHQSKTQNGKKNTNKRLICDVCLSVCCSLVKLDSFSKSDCTVCCFAWGFVEKSDGQLHSGRIVKIDKDASDCSIYSIFFDHFLRANRQLFPNYILIFQ